MSKLIVALLTVGTMLLLVAVGPVAVNEVALITKNISTVSENQPVIPVNLPKLENLLLEPKPLKAQAVKKTLILEADNTVTLRGAVTSKSVADVMVKLRKMSADLPSNKEIYLVLDTPGGSVFDGADLIDFSNALPQKVNTVTLFAASMGFQIAQHLDQRLIVPNGVLMSHRASISGLGGQFDGELESRYKMYKRKIDFLDSVSSKRLGLTLPEYKEKINPEYWIHGFDAVNEKVADEQILLRCGKSLKGTETVTFNTFFGMIDVDFSKCPLVKVPLDIRIRGVKTKKSENFLKSIAHLMINNKEKFIQQYIQNNKFETVFPVK